MSSSGVGLVSILSSFTSGNNVTIFENISTPSFKTLTLVLVIKFDTLIKKFKYVFFFNKFNFDSAAIEATSYGS